VGNVTPFLYYVIHNYKGHFAVEASVSHSNPHFPKPSPGCPRFKLGTVEALATSSGLQPASESTVLHGGAGTCRHLPGSAMKVFLEFDVESQRSGYLFYLKKTNEPIPSAVPCFCARSFQFNTTNPRLQTDDVGTILQFEKSATNCRPLVAVGDKFHQSTSDAASVKQIG